MEPVPELLVQSTFQPAGDQPTAIAALAEGVERGDRYQTLLGITGSGKTATIAWTIEQVQRPTLIIEPNKCLAAQLAAELRELFPQEPGRVLRLLLRLLPARGVPARRRDTYIEKDSSINDEIDRLRHSATAALLTAARRHRGGLGLVHLRPGLARRVPGPASLDAARRATTTTSARSCAALVDLQYDRNDVTLGRGKFRVRGDTIEVHPAYEEHAAAHRAVRRQVERIPRRRPADR